jgi:transcriptional regulator with XRE-family HTH domain
MLCKYPGMTLHEWLAQKGLSLAEFGRLIGKSAPTVSRFVRGIGNPDLETMLAIQQATGGKVTVAEQARKKSVAAE